MRFQLAIALLLVLGAVSTGQSLPRANSRSPHGALDIPCQNCHTSIGWKPIRAVPEFDHNHTKFPLRGMHESVTCTQCHTRPVFSNTPTRCSDCHADIHKRQFGANCEQCHSVKGWKVQIEQIKQHQNRFPLLGAHAVTDCDACHKSAALSKYSTMPTDCYSCHAADFKAAVNPNHVTGNFSTSCDRCHGFDNWLNAKFDHSATGFPLTGLHTVPPRQCADCHKNNNFNLTNTTCVSCHLSDFTGTTNPNHVQLGFAQTCESCHSTSGWSPANFDHSKSGFPLTGLHMVPPRQCTDCHKKDNYTITNTTCVSCHLSDFTGTTNPNHVQQGIPQTCEVCHTTSGWSPASFDHSKTGFPLTGLHTVPPRQCTDCHINNNYNITNTTCVSCHLKDYQGTTNPNHVQQGIPQTCDVCHTTSGWSPANFDHSKTGFPLTGSHTVPPRQCTDCHINNNYSITNTTCVSCHQNDYNNAKSPVNHVAANFPTTCQQCHDTVQWTDGTFNHAATGWALTGSHTVPPRQCTDCHVNGNYNITVTTCVSCHQTDYNNATSPVNHIAANFPTTCEVCHDTAQWSDGTFNHAATGWALTGSHTVPPRQCTDCHVNGNYNITVTTCVSCHQTDYNNAKSPVDHIAANFPTTCQICHDTVQWTDGTFNHAATGWALTGSHTVPPRQCSDCHVNGNYNITTTLCYSCHVADYNGTTNPNHKAAGFPTTCDTCHNTTSWSGAVFNHTWWDINHGGANGVCSTCHTNPNDYSVFQCTNCHTKSQTDQDHQGISGYVYNSVNCYQCHKNGGGGGNARKRR